MSARSEEEALAAELSSCMLSHYKYCAAGVLLGLPLSIHKRSYWPVTMAAVAGTAVDFKEASVNCAPQREAFMAYVARKGAEGPAKAKQGAPSTASAEDPTQASSGEAWPVEEQQGWSEKGWEQNFDTSSDGRESGTRGKNRW
ncbi:unnamed protein product [Hapterophycus canaliculatus]